jgi:hypothetical protein
MFFRLRYRLYFRLDRLLGDVLDEFLDTGIQSSIEFVVLVTLHAIKTQFILQAVWDIK